jgi:hypothetical protein
LKGSAVVPQKIRMSGENALRRVRLHRELSGGH